MEKHYISSCFKKEESYFFLQPKKVFGKKNQFFLSFDAFKHFIIPQTTFSFSKTKTRKKVALIDKTYKNFNEIVFKQKNKGQIDKWLISLISFKLTLEQKKISIIIFIQNLQMQELFKQALSYVKSLPSDSSEGQKIDNQTKLKFYAFFKQATIGQNKTKAPSRLKIVEKYKWDEWKKLGKMSKEEAMKAYVQALTEKVPTWNQNPKL